MSWISHPRFVPVRDSILQTLRAKEYHFRRVKRVAFLCGGFESPRRDRLAEYISRHRSDFLVFYAEAVWNVIAAQPDANALQMESQLAELADIVIIVVESAGTFTELGAFALSPELRKKLLPILPTEHREAESFINTGPVRWVDRESDFAPAIWTDHRVILGATEEVDERLARLPPSGSARVSDIANHPKHLLFFICDLVMIFGPTGVKDIEYYCAAILDGEPAMPVPLLLALAGALGLIKAVGEVPYYFRPLDNDRLISFQYKRRYIDMIGLRAQVLDVIQGLDEGVHALDLVAAHGAD